MTRTTRTGRTVRSSFSPRNEGILVLKETSYESEGEESKTNETIYSLGKQNRWLIPEMVKNSSNLKSNFEDEDILLVERENGMKDRTKRTRRGDCMSVYESASGHFWEPKGKYGQTDSLVEKANRTRVIYEVTYRNNAKCNLNISKSSRKKYVGKERTCMTVDEADWQQVYDNGLIEEDHFDVDYYDEDDSMIDHTMFLGDFMCGSKKRDKVNSNHVISKDNSTKSDSELQTHTASPPNSKVIFIDDEEMASQHEKMYALSRKTNSLLEKLFAEPYYYWKNYTRKKKYIRKILKKVYTEDMEISKTKEEEPKLMSQESPIVESPPCVVSLWDNDLEISELKATWGDMYLEGASHPRKFAINLLHEDNCLSNITGTGLSLAYILFELHSNGNKTTNHSEASIKLLLDSELPELKMTGESANLIIADFCNLIGGSRDVVEVKKVVGIAIKCIKKHVIIENCAQSDITQMNKTFSPTLYEHVLGWKGQCYTENEALDEIKEEVIGKNRKEVPLLLESSDPSTECGICFEDLAGKADCVFTTMNSCGHSFCNDCWKLYLVAKLNSGQVVVLCPGHSCKTLVDLVTIMSVVPSLFGKYLAWKVKRGMASGPSWKNCPSEQCNLVLKVSACDSNGNGTIPPYLPVSCSCTSIWCFNCQEQAHWPAPCEEVQKFRAANKGYTKARKGRQLPEIVAVSIKRCPNCSYPIEKFDGCNHMYCYMCAIDFCWHCLTVLNYDNYDHCCDDTAKAVHSTVVEIPVATSKAQLLADLAVVSFCTVKSGISVNTWHKLKSLEQGLEAYSSLKNLSKRFATSKTGSILENMMVNNVTHVLKEAYSFEIQAHVALEGMLICLVPSAKDTILHEYCTRVLFIMDKIRVILSNTALLHKEQNVVKLNELIENGQKCFMELGRHVKRNAK